MSNLASQQLHNLCTKFWHMLHLDEYILMGMCTCRWIDILPLSNFPCNVNTKPLFLCLHWLLGCCLLYGDVIFRVPKRKSSLLWLQERKGRRRMKKVGIKSVCIHMCHSINIIPKPFLRKIHSSNTYSEKARGRWNEFCLLGLNPIAHSAASTTVPYNRLCMFEVQLLSKVSLFTLVSRWLNIRFQLSFFI